MVQILLDINKINKRRNANQNKKGQKWFSYIKDSLIPDVERKSGKIKVVNRVTHRTVSKCCLLQLTYLFIRVWSLESRLKKP